jgi:hypothetical protein
MNFTLTYDGELKTDGNKQHKHEIRRVFHRQLAEFWKASPICQLKKPDDALVRTIGKYKFFPLTSSARNEVAELQITLLRPHHGPGYIIGEGGDIDNRLKTLFDSLRMPRTPDEIPGNDHLGEDEDPFFCLLEDDILITRLSVQADRLLEPCISRSCVKLIIAVSIMRVPMVGANMIIGIG